LLVNHKSITIPSMFEGLFS